MTQMMKAIQVDAPKTNFKLVQRPIPEPKENEILIKVEACGICHGDGLVLEGHFPGIKYPIIPGHEVVGTVHKLGAKADLWKLGQRVGVGWHGGHCFKCQACQKGDFGACENALVTGISRDGGYAEYMTAAQEAVVSIPEKLDLVQGAPLLCAGRTTFGALKDSIAQAGDVVAIHGLGGLGHLAVQYAQKFGFKTVVLSRGKEKEALAYKLGAHFYIDTNSMDAVKELNKMGGARVILCTAPNSKAIASLIPSLSRRGEAVIVAGAGEPMTISPLLLLGGERSIKGYVSGSIEETLDFSILYKIMPMVEIFPLEQAAIGFERMMTSKVNFRSVLKMAL